MRLVIEILTYLHEKIELKEGVIKHEKCEKT